MEVSQFEKRINARIAQWKERLIDLSRRNNLIYFRRTRNVLFVESPSIKDIFEQFTIKEKSFGFWYPTLPVDSSQLDLLEFTEEEMLDAQEIPNPTPPKTREFKTHIESYRDLQRILRNLYRRSQLDHRERGVRILHLALGMLHWIETESSEQEVHSPLILCPAELSYDQETDKFTLAPADDAEITLNPALQAKLQHDFQLSLPELPEDFVCFSELNSVIAFQEFLHRKLGGGQNDGFDTNSSRNYFDT